MVAEVLDAILSWPTFVIALVVFGFAPGAVLRLIVLAFPNDDPRRRELLAELHAVPRLERPFWVAEQLELALFEGIWGRLVWAATGRIIDRWRLDDSVAELHRGDPEMYGLSDEEIAAIEPGTVVKLTFTMKDGWAESMWVETVAVNKGRFIGTLDNQPVGIPRLHYGDKIKFTRDHIIRLWDDQDPRNIVPVRPE
ncbi:MAG TPA: DUF2314 domain-containing protein [Micromonosporaceae bacterium]|nr:DUF2314 domain-containing protein [Micromonosporaceae bacterium]